MPTLQNLEQQLECLRLQLEDSILNNDTMVQVTTLYSDMKRLELLIKGRKSLLFRKDCLN
jgi:hypothetical protein